MEQLHFVDACTDEHFRAMSLIHALGWRDTYVDAVPAEYMAREITDERWVPFFRDDYRLKRCHGLLLYRDDSPVACINYGTARTENYNAGTKEGSDFPNAAMDRLRQEGYKNCFVFVLRENEKARRFYAAHGFAWDGTHADIPFPPDAICVDLRYTREL